ncbi:MAG: polysaccharide deacetylase family protein, partial [Rubrivivax sp.]
MASGRWITRAAEAFAGLCLASAASAASPDDCRKPLYLTFDTGHMAVAPLIADVLARHQVKVTFFA